MEKNTATETAAAKKITATATVTQDDMLNSRMEELFLEKMSKMEANQVTLGCVVNRVSKSEGKPRLDANNQPLINQETGEVLRWNDSFYVDITFLGGSDTLRLNPEIAKTLEENKRYVATGVVKLVTPTEGKAYTTIEYKGFERLF